jgi:lipopolysaccharide transport system ATP-binding protein
LKPILEIQGLSKLYQIEGNRKPYLSLRESISGMFRAGSRKEEFWALQDINFNLMPGDTLGIIGKNGAGKSTLLKILSKITPPTKGKIIARGRIASLLEVGTGFHPELNGRENIFMNGSILGMKRQEIQQHFDAIVDFSGVEKFLETPLKHYSSGMQLRLAFAVAAFLEPEILVIDEVLAVGDSEFQKKCLNKMEDVSKSGRTILFVSHQLSAVDSLCNKSIILNKGQLIKAGPTAACIESYLSMGAELRTESKNYEHVVMELSAANLSGNHKIDAGETLIISGKYQAQEEIDNPTIGLVIKNMYNVPVLGINNRSYGITLSRMQKGKAFEIVLRDLPLMPGTYDIDLFIGDGLTDRHSFENILSFEVNDRLLFEGGKNPDSKLNPFILKNTDWHLK